METIQDRYTRNHPKSAVLYEESKLLFPSGVTHDTRYLQPFPVYMTRAKGPRKWDVDGNEYVDFVMGHGSLLLGHAHPEVVAAVSSQLTTGTHLGSNTQQEIRWARAVKSLMPNIEKIRFHSSGTEATMMASRLARAFTGKSKVLKFAHHFHGWHDCVVPASGKYSTAGIPRSTQELTQVVPIPDIDEVMKAVAHGDVAAVMLEPTGAKMGSLPIAPTFLQQLRELTEDQGIVLIFDEVVTGFRVSPGGAQERFGIRPDLTTLAKILAGGLPGGAVGGRTDIVDMISFHNDAVWDSHERVGHPGTFNANPLCAAAGATCLETIASEPANERADAAAARLRNGIVETFARTGVQGGAYGFASLVWFLFGTEISPEHDIYGLDHAVIGQAVAAHDYKSFKRALVNEGVDIMGQNALIVSAVHEAADIDYTLKAFEAALLTLKREGLCPLR